METMCYKISLFGGDLGLQLYIQHLKEFWLGKRTKVNTTKDIK